MRNAIILAIPESKIHILQTLGGRTLEEIINRSINDDALTRRMDGEASDFNAVFTRNVLDERGLADDFDEFFAGVAVLVDVADVAGCHGAVEGDGDGVLCRVSREGLEGKGTVNSRECLGTMRRRGG